MDPLTMGLAGISLYNGLKGLFARKRPAAESEDERAFKAMTTEQQNRGRSLSSTFDEGITAFDPMTYMDTAAGGMFGDFKRDFGQNLAQMRAGQVGGGRIRTGFRTGDEDRLFTGMGSQLSDRLAQLSMQGAGMNLDRLGMIGNAGQNATGLAMDARFGRYATEKQDAAQRSAGRWGALGNIGGALLNAGATYWANRK